MKDYAALLSRVLALRRSRLYPEILYLISPECEDERLRYYRGMALAETGAYDEAMKVFIELGRCDWLTALTPEHNPLFCTGCCLFCRKRYHEANEWFLKAQTAVPAEEDWPDSRPFKWSGACYHLISDFTSAITQYRSSLAIYEQDVLGGRFSFEERALKMAVDGIPLREEDLSIRAFELEFAEE